MDNDQQHEMLCGILTRLVPILSCDELSLLAYHCGVSISDLYEPSKDQHEFKEAA